MATDNQVVVVGNLVDDPELRFTPQGVAVANFRIAVSPRFKDANGQWKDGETSYFRINCWRQLAENVAETLTRGSRTMVVGRLKMRQWETQDGEKRSVVEIEADEVGPSLKWATAKVEKTSRGGGGGERATTGAPRKRRVRPRRRFPSNAWGPGGRGAGRRVNGTRTERPRARDEGRMGTKAAGEGLPVLPRRRDVGRLQGSPASS